MNQSMNVVCMLFVLDKAAKFIVCDLSMAMHYKQYRGMLLVSTRTPPWCLQIFCLYHSPSVRDGESKRSVCSVPISSSKSRHLDRLTIINKPTNSVSVSHLLSYVILPGILAAPNCAAAQVNCMPRCTQVRLETCEYNVYLR